MNREQIQGDWKQFSGRVKEQWGKLTDHELTVIAGKRDQLAGLHQHRYGDARSHAENELIAFTQGLDPLEIIL